MPCTVDSNVVANSLDHMGHPPWLDGARRSNQAHPGYSMAPNFSKPK